MAWYDPDIHVSIIDATFPLAVPSLSMPVVLDFTPGAAKKNRFLQYTSVEAVGADFDEETPPYRMANRHFAQQPHAAKFAVWNISRFDYKKATKKTGNPATDSGLIWIAQEIGAPGDTIKIEVALNTENPEQTVVVVTTTPTPKVLVKVRNDGEDPEESARNIRLLVNNHPTAAQYVFVALDPNNTGSGNGIHPFTPETTLNRLNTPDSPVELTRGLNKMWDYIYENDLDQPYFLLCPTRDYDDGMYVPGVAGDRLELSNAVSSRVMFYLTGNRGKSLTDDGLELPPVSKSMVQEMASDRSLLFWHDRSESIYGEAAIAGLWGGIEPGGITLRWKRLNGIPPAKAKESDIFMLRGQAPGSPGAFTYAKAFGSPVLTGSWATDGSFADWRRNKDWLRLHLQARIFFSLRNRPIVLFDARGLAVIRAAISEVLSQATTKGIIAVDEDGRELWELRIPKLKDFPILARARRRATGIQALIHPAGAIEEVALTVWATFEEFSTFMANPGL